jgi:adenosylcobyric acid synthase
VVKLPRISNYTDFDPLENEPDVVLHYIETKEHFHGLDLLVIPGSKATIADLNHLADAGLLEAIRAFSGEIVGICGGYQMLGKLVLDPDSLESEIRHADGLGLLEVATVMHPEKQTHQTVASLLEGGREFAPCRSGVLRGYEIHMGETVLGDEMRPFARITSRSGEKVDMLDGAVSQDGRIMGTYIHGIFENDGFRSAMLNRLRRKKGLSTITPVSSDADPLEQLAEHLEKHLDISRILKLCGLGE